MKRFKFIRTPVILVVIVLIWQGCCTSNLHFSGKVVDKSGNGIPEATVKVGEEEEKTDKNGEFKICVDRAERVERYVLNVSAAKFGFVSKLYSSPTSDILITLAKATVVQGRADQEIFVQDLNPDMIIPESAKPLAPHTPLDTLPFVHDAKGRLISFTWPQELKNSYKAIRNFARPRMGASVRIPAGSLVFEDSRKNAEGEVEVSMNTVDLYSEDGMPGNYGVDTGNEGATYMVSFGAANIEAFQDDKPLQLGDKKMATLTIPVDTLSILRNDSLPATIPFLVYNRTTGLWDRRGDAKLNVEKTAYVTEVSHFSTFNMDMLKVDPACHQLINKLVYPVPPNPWTMEVTLSTGGSTAKELKEGCDPSAIPGTDEYTAIVNLPADMPIGIRIFNNGVISSTYVAYGGPGGAYTNQTALAAMDASCDYTACSGPTKIEAARCPIDGTKQGPYLAIDRESTDVFHFTWVHIHDISGTTINTVPLFYKIQYSENEDFSTPADFLEFAAGVTEENGSIGQWIFDKTVTLQPGVMISEDSGTPVFFRVVVSTSTGGTFVNGAVTYINDYPNPASFNACTGIGQNN